MGVQAMLEAADLVMAGKHKETVQDEAQATYEGWCRTAEAKLNFANHVDFVYNTIRGCNPAPGAWTALDGTALQIFESKPLPARDPKGIGGKMGEIVEVAADGFTVVCADGRIKVLRVKTADGPKIAAGEFAANAKLTIGTRLA
jgi:methionyl-tRNA formyltransferase